MTLNGQQTPTFSFQKYFYTPSEYFTPPESLYEYPSIVPAAVSSELDNHGEERIHIAPYVEDTSYDPAPVCVLLYGTDVWGTGGDNSSITIDFADNMPVWFDPESPFVLEFDGLGSATYAQEEFDNYERQAGGVEVIGFAEGGGTFTQGENSICMNYSIPAGF